MNLLIIGSADQVNECQLKFGQQHTISTAENLQDAIPHFSKADVVLDFLTPLDLPRVVDYPKPTTIPVFFDTSLIRLSEILSHAPWLHDTAIGFCGLRTFVNRDMMEIVVPNEEASPRAKQVCDRLGTDFRLVSDQAGMVTPRVLCMIINEAFYTLEDETASRQDIDLAMKLGTNYPYGPFEWAERIGLKNVVKVLQAAGRDSGDPRYAVCPLLMRQADA